MLILFYFLLGKLFTIIVGFVFFKSILRPYKFVLCLVIIATICEMYGYYLSHIHKPNFWLFNLYMLFEIWFMGIAAIYFVDKKNIKKLFLLLLVISSIIWLSIVISNSISTFANFALVCNSVILAVMYIIVLFKNSLFSKKNILIQPIFWVSISTIIYFSCIIPYMGLHNYLSDNMPAIAGQLMDINDVLDIVRFPLIGISFILLGRKNKVVKHSLIHEL